MWKTKVLATSSLSYDLDPEYGDLVYHWSEVAKSRQQGNEVLGIAEWSQAVYGDEGVDVLLRRVDCTQTDANLEMPLSVATLSVPANITCPWRT